MPEYQTVEDVLLNLDLLKLQVDKDGEHIVDSTKNKINELVEIIDRLRRGETDLPIPNRASQESGS